MSHHHNSTVTSHSDTGYIPDSYQITINSVKLIDLNLNVRRDFAINARPINCSCALAPQGQSSDATYLETTLARSNWREEIISDPLPRLFNPMPFERDHKASEFTS